jgi:hypothetical protein
VGLREFTMLKPPTLVVTALLIVGAAIVHGAVTQRWSVFAPNPAQTDRLHALEVRSNDWKAEKDPVETEMPTNERSTATARRYLSPDGTHSCVVTIISGIPGSVSTHTPDVCYVGSGYKCLRGPKKETLELAGGATVAFYVADFEKKNQSKLDRVRVRWAWSTDGTWIAPDSPRWQFAKQLNAVPVLYKLYIATPLPETGEDRSAEDDSQTKEFVAAAWAQFSAAFGGGK